MLPTDELTIDDRRKYVKVMGPSYKQVKLKNVAIVRMSISISPDHRNMCSIWLLFSWASCQYGCHTEKKVIKAQGKRSCQAVVLRCTASFSRIRGLYRRMQLVASRRASELDNPLRMGIYIHGTIPQKTYQSNSALMCQFNSQA
jgi:hypothetical protein